MYYTYVLLSSINRKFYVGSTDDLKRRIREHNEGRGGAYTKRNKPLRLVFYEAFLSKKDAVKQEKFYKSGYGKEILKEKTEGSLKFCL